MNGRDYIATVRLTNKPGDVLAMPGETCERVPTPSLRWLAQQGLIIPVAEAVVTQPIREAEPVDGWRTFEPIGDKVVTPIDSDDERFDRED